MLPWHCHYCCHDVRHAGAQLYEGRGTYSDVIKYAERLFARIRQAVACQQAPTTLKAAFLDPVRENLATEVALEMFAKTDQEFMSMFTGNAAKMCQVPTATQLM